MYSKTHEKPAPLLSLNALRALAFLGIFFEHTKLLWAGAWGVSVFLILSGFLMTYNYYNRILETTLKAVVSFAWSKIAKLYPLHILTFLAILPLCMKNIESASFLKVFLSNILLLQSWSGNSITYFSFNAVSWYLSTCVFLYLSFPFILKYLKKYTKNSTAFYGIIITLTLQLVFAYASTFLPEVSRFSDNLCKWFTYIFPIYRLGDFIIGCNLGYLFLHKTASPSKGFSTIIEFLTFLLTGGLLFVYSTNFSLGAMEWFRYTLLYTGSSILLVYSFALNAGYLTKLLTNPLLTTIGAISSYAFLLHAIVIRYINRLFLLKNGYSLSTLKLTIVALPLTFVCSLLYMQIEKYLTRIIRSKHITN